MPKHHRKSPHRLCVCLFLLLFKSLLLVWPSCPELLFMERSSDSDFDDSSIEKRPHRWRRNRILTEFIWPILSRWICIMLLTLFFWPFLFLSSWVKFLKPIPDDSRKEEGRSLQCKEMSCAQKMDDKKKRQEISESEPRSNDSSVEENSRRWPYWIVTSICNVLLFLFNELILFFAFWFTVNFAWDYLMKWEERQQASNDSEA